MDKAIGSDADEGCDHNERTEGHGKRQFRHLFVILAVIRFSRTMSLYFLVGYGELGRFLWAVRRARSDAGSVLDRLGYVSVLAIQPPVGKELEDKI
jgi:hypothetical protein